MLGLETRQSEQAKFFYFPVQSEAEASQLHSQVSLSKMLGWPFAFLLC